MSLALSRLMPRRAFALALALALVGAGVGVASAAKPDHCLTTMAGVYYKSADVFTNLSPDGTLSGQFSKTTQAFIGLGETFVGTWTCSGDTITTQDFHFYEYNSSRYVERGDGTGTFSTTGGGTLALTYTFTLFDETATPAEVKSGTGLGQIPGVTATLVRVSTP